MGIRFNGATSDPTEINYNEQIVSEVYYNGKYIWPITSTTYFKYIFLEHVDDGEGLNENVYELHISRVKLDDNYIYNPNLDKAPLWQFPQPNVVGPNNEPYATPMSFVRRVVFDNALSPHYLNYWFDHLYGGLNTNWSSQKYPFEWVNLKNLRLNHVISLNCAFQFSHIPYIDLTDWDVENVESTQEMFKGCSAEHIYIGNKWNLSKVTNSYHMFFRAVNLPGYDSAKTDISMAKLVSQGGYLEKK